MNKFEHRIKNYKETINPKYAGNVRGMITRSRANEDKKKTVKANRSLKSTVVSNDHDDDDIDLDNNNLEATASTVYVPVVEVEAVAGTERVLNRNKSTLIKEPSHREKDGDVVVPDDISDDTSDVSSDVPIIDIIKQDTLTIQKDNPMRGHVIDIIKIILGLIDTLHDFWTTPIKIGKTKIYNIKPEHSKLINYIRYEILYIMSLSTYRDCIPFIRNILIYKKKKKITNMLEWIEQIYSVHDSEENKIINLFNFYDKQKNQILFKNSLIKLLNIQSTYIYTLTTNIINDFYFMLEIFNIKPDISISNENILLHRNLIYYIITMVKTAITTNDLTIFTEPNNNNLNDIFYKIFNLNLIESIKEYLGKLSLPSEMKQVIKNINELYPMTFPSSYILDQRSNNDEWHAMGYSLFINNKRDFGPAPTYNSIIKNTNAKKHYLTFINEDIKAGWPKYNIYGIDYNSHMIHEFTRYMFYPDNTDEITPKAITGIDISNPSEVITVDENTISNINHAIIETPIDNITKLGLLYGAKRMGDWLQCEQATLYKVLLQTGDFWCKMYALLIDAPIIIDNYLYNYDPYKDYLEEKKLQEEDWFNFYSATKTKIPNGTKSLKSLSDILLTFYSKPNIDAAPAGGVGVAAGVAEAGPAHGRVKLPEIFESHPILITKENFFKVIKKYLKYKNKYLKTKTGKTIDNHEIDAIRNNLFENVNESNIKQHIEQIKNKYLKYKNKYLRINILE